ncbi:uncharacterized protein WM294_001377 [Sarcoramphus papa]
MKATHRPPVESGGTLILKKSEHSCAVAFGLQSRRGHPVLKTQQSQFCSDLHSEGLLTSRLWRSSAIHLSPYASAWLHTDYYCALAELPVHAAVLSLLKDAAKPTTRTSTTDFYNNPKGRLNTLPVEKSSGVDIPISV